MKKIFFLFCLTVFLSAAVSASSNDKAAVNFIRTLIKISGKADNGYLDALRYFQYTATTYKSNPSSYVLSPYGKSALKESGIKPKDKGKMIPVVKDRSASRITKLWSENKSGLLKLLTLSQYNRILKREVDSLIKFHDLPQYQEFMTVMQEQNPVPDTETLEKAGNITDWTWYRELSFWHRRVHEKNDDAVYSIFKELQEHYGK